MRKVKGRGEDEWISTHSGRQFWPLAPRADEVDIDDIAWGLSHQCRWTGQCMKFYSIAQHSVRVALLLKKNGFGPGVQFEALHHDDTEAYIADVSRPIKRQKEFKPYLRAEEKLEKVIFSKFGIVKSHSGLVKDADTSLLSKESEELMTYIGVQGEARFIPRRFHVRSEWPKGPLVSYYRFLYHHYRLSGELSGKEGLLNNATALFRSIFR